MGSSPSESPHLGAVFQITKTSLGLCVAPRKLVRVRTDQIGSSPGPGGFKVIHFELRNRDMAAAAFRKHGKKIIAIGRNYAEHIKELNNTPPKEPFFFLKPTTSYLSSGGQVEIPKGIIAHHEVELGLIIGKGGRDISQADSDSHIAGYALAVDMTARNLQDEVKKLGLPWTAAKGFDTFTPVGSFIPKTSIIDPHNLGLSLKINGTFKQNGITADMIFRIPRLIEHVSSIMTLEEGDLLLTGTPSGVGPISAGDNVECALADLSSGKQIAAVQFSVVDREGGYHFHPSGSN